MFDYDVESETTLSFIVRHKLQCFVPGTTDTKQGVRLRGEGGGGGGVKTLVGSIAENRDLNMSATL